MHRIAQRAGDRRPQQGVINSVLRTSRGAREVRRVRPDLKLLLAPGYSNSALKDRT
jgi:hypothetical protein